MILVEPRLRIDPTSDLPRVSERNYFRAKLDFVLDSLLGLEMRMGSMSLGIPREFHWMEYDMQKKELGTAAHLDDLFPSEQKLYRSLFDLFEIKHGIGEENQSLVSRLDGPFGGKSIVFLGGLASGKTTIAKGLDDSFKVGLVTEPLLQNPFLVHSEDLDKDNPHKPMLQSQIFYLLSSILSNIAIRLREGISISDTSVFNDSLLWAPFYSEIEHLTKGGYQTYQKMAALFKPIFAKPDLLVCVVAETPQQLFEDKILRGRPNEQGEIFSLANLAIQNRMAHDLAQSLGEQFGISVLELVVSPLKMYQDGKPSPKEIQKYVEMIRGELNY